MTYNETKINYIGMAAATFAAFAAMSSASAQVLFSNPPEGKPAAVNLTAPTRHKLTAAEAARFAPPVFTIPVPSHPLGRATALAAGMDFSGPGVVLKGHRPADIDRSSKVGPRDSSSTMQVVFALRPRNTAAMNALVHRIYDRKDPLFHHFLKPEERIARFSPSQADFDKVAAFIASKGLQVTDMSPDRQFIKATGSVAAVQSALKVHINNYQRTNGEQFFGPDTDPTVPAKLSGILTGILNLSDADKPHTNMATAKPGQHEDGPAKGAGSGAAGSSGASPADIGVWAGTGLPAEQVRTVYNLNLYNSSGTHFNGQGQNVALIEAAGFQSYDIGYYIGYNYYVADPNISLNTIPIAVHPLNGYDESVNGSTDECELDIEMIEAIADGVNQINVYEEANTGVGFVIDEADQILNDDTSNIVSASFGSNEPDPVATGQWNTVTEEMAIQGQAVFVSSGDNGAYSGTSSPTVSVLAASPWVTGVGGTSLWINEDPFSNYGAFSGEAVWNNSAGASGGGVSQWVSCPDYQQGYLANDGYASSASASYFNRDVPDVALDSDPYTGYYTHLAYDPVGSYSSVGWDVEEGGTSAAAPIWAAFTADVDSALNTYGYYSLGFLNYDLYAIAQGGDYNSDFHDVYSYNNGYYNSVTGYDCCTGLGSLDGVNMANDLFGYGPFTANPSMSGPSYATSGEGMPFTLNVSPAVPSGDNGQFVLYQIDQYGNVTNILDPVITGGNSGSTISVQAPEVSQASTYYYVAFFYYTHNGNELGYEYETNEFSVTVSPNLIYNLTVSPSVIVNTTSGTGTVTLDEPAATTEVIDLFSSNTSVATVPTTVTIPQNVQSITFPVTAGTVSGPTALTISAVPDASSAMLKVPFAATATVEPLIGSMTLAKTTMTGGGSTTGTIVLAEAAPANEVVTLHCSDASISSPKSITILAGASSGTFTLKTTPVAANDTATVTATLLGTAMSANETVLAPVLKSVKFSPTSVVGPATINATVTINGKAPTHGLVVTLSSSNTAAATVAASVTVPAGATFAAFTVSAEKVTKKASVTISASVGESSPVVKGTVSVKP